MRINQKWGFGMAPVKPGTQHQRDLAAAALLSLLEACGCPHPSAADCIPEVKGLFSRSWRQDQWDWFTVWTQLGRPGRNRCRTIAGDLGEFRRAILGQDADRVETRRKQLREAGTNSPAPRFPRVSPANRGEAPGIGYVYILSTRTNPELLKIGYTERTAEQRAGEINSATGVAEPYGVRAVWTVRNAPQMEKLCMKPWLDTGSGRTGNSSNSPTGERSR
jgi:T5orf172 domain